MKKEIDRINKLAGNQARIMLLYIFQKGLLDKANYWKVKDAFEVAESYHPESQLKSF